MRYDVGRFRRPMRRGVAEQMVSLISLGDGSTLSLDFTAMSSLDSRFTYTRNSIATFINSSGLVQQVTAAPSNDPTKARFDHDPTTLAPRGLLLEGSATNIVTYSNDFANAIWQVDNGSATNPAVSTVSQTGPDGASTVTRITFNKTGGTFSRIRQTLTGTASTAYTMSVWMKANTASGGASTQNVGIRIGADSAGFNCVVTTTWKRFQYTYTLSNTDAAAQIMLWDNIVGNDETADVLVYGCQIELGSGASSYIPTGASTVQRAADSCEITGTNFSSWWPANQSEFTVLWTGDITRSPATTQFLWLNRNSGGSSRSRGYVNTSSVIRANAVALYDFTASPATNATVNTVFKHALAVKTGDSAMYVNSGTTIGSETTTTALGSGFDADKIIFNPNSDNFMHMRTLKFWPQRLPNATLNGLVT